MMRGLPSFHLAALLVVLLFSADAIAKEARFNPPNTKPYLGVAIRETDDGPLISEILSGGAAERSGLERDDLLVGFGPWRFGKSDQSLVEHLSGATAAPTMVRVLRDGAPLDIAITPDTGMAKVALAIHDAIDGHRLFKKADRELHDSLAEDLLTAANSAKTEQAAYDAMNEVIDGFDLSHASILTPWVSENLFGKDGGHFDLGMFIQRLEFKDEQRHFIRSMMFGSPARAAGLQIGDEILRVNGHSFADSPRRTLAGYEGRRNMYAIQVDPEETVTIRYRRHPNARPASAVLTANRALDAVSSAKKSVRLLGEGKDIGYVHFWNVMAEGNVYVLRDALEGPFKNATALVIDLRGRGGRVQVISALSRTLSREKRPVTLLIDREARSAKEMLAYRLQGRRHITLIGETTAGAVLPANSSEVSSGARLMLPIPMGDAAIRMFTRGKRLEGIGTVPDIKINAPIPYRAGKDPILDGALKFLEKQEAGKLLRL